MNLGPVHTARAKDSRSGNVRTAGLRPQARFLRPKTCLEDERVLFIVVRVSSNDGEPLTQFKMPSATMPETAVFVLCIESNAIREQALLLIESIRAFTGKLRNLEIFAIAPRPNLGVDKETRVKLDALDVTYCEVPINTFCPEYGSANRVYAAAWVAQRTSATTLIVLDSDTLFLDEPELLGPCSDVAVRPVDLKGSATIGPEDEFDPYWVALCELAEMPIDLLPFLETTVDRIRVRSSYNGGYSVVRRDTGIMERAAEIFTRSVSANLRPFKGRPNFRVLASTGLVSSLASEYWGSSQATFSIAAWSSTRRVRTLDARYNVPLHLLDQSQYWPPEWIEPAPVHVHYHFMFDPEHRAEGLELLRRLGIPADRLEWVVAHLPLSSRAVFDHTTVRDPTALSARCNLLNLELQELKTQNAELRAALSERESNCARLAGQLRTELSERDIEREELQGQIRSIQGSICWRLTGPIRWLHKQVQFRAGKKPR
jgi:FtsZ-binding cell division protein ZapB